VALPALVLVLGVALAALDLGVAQVRCVDAARTGARLLARGDPPEAARAAALGSAPRGSTWTMHAADGDVTVTVTAPLPNILRGWSSVPAATATAVSALEGQP
jgi:hypothetical protein